MFDPDERTRERVLLFQRLRELTAERIETENARQQRIWILLEEKNRATVERLAYAKIPAPFELKINSTSPPRRI